MNNIPNSISTRSTTTLINTGNAVFDLKVGPPSTFKLTTLSLLMLASLTACNQSGAEKNKQKDKQVKVEVVNDVINEGEQKQIIVEQAQQDQGDVYQSELKNHHVLQSKERHVARIASTKKMVQTKPSSLANHFIVNEPLPVELPAFSTTEDREHYLSSLSNPVKQVSVDPVSTFSIDVDTGSYSNSRRFLNNGKLPPNDAVREEAFINYFNYNYASPTNLDVPFKVHTEVGNAPWNEQRQLVKIGIKGFEVAKVDLKSANLVFLLDVSGSMNAPDKLPLLTSSLTMLTKQLDEDDSVAIVVYAGAAGVVLPATSGNNHQIITQALNQLSAGGSTNGAQGIELAYQIAEKNFKKGGVNRVILATDGDFNVGTQSIDKLKALIAKKRQTGIALTTLGFGQGNYNDGLMEQLANIGNGQHAYIDTINEARKVLVDELTSTMQIIAKDVKIQVEFNPQQVAEYRLIGYQNRLLANEDFNNDKVDAAELGAGHTVTALYEVTLVGANNKQIDDLRYQDFNSQTKHNSKEKPSTLNNQELAFVKVRYKQPNSDISQLISQPIFAQELNRSTSKDFQFSAAVAGFTQLLKGAKYTNQWQYQDCIDLAIENKGEDYFGYRAEFIQLVRIAQVLQ